MRKPISSEAYQSEIGYEKACICKDTVHQSDTERERVFIFVKVYIKETLGKRDLTSAEVH